MYEPAQEGDKDGVDLFDDPLEEKADQIAQYLGYARIGWIIAHPPREDGFTLSAREILMACQQRTEIGKEKVFVTVKVTPDEEGNAVFDAFQVSDQCLEMYEAEALVEHSNPKFCAVSETFSAIVEARTVPVVENDFFLITVPITQHDSSLASSFPKANRASPQTRDSLASILTDKGNLPFRERISDFALLIYLCEFMDINR
jgi:nuclear protein localization family protein 4